jgi:hypothetical protein
MALRKYSFDWKVFDEISIKISIIPAAKNIVAENASPVRNTIGPAKKPIDPMMPSVNASSVTIKGTVNAPQDKISAITKAIHPSIRNDRMSARRALYSFTGNSPFNLN